MQDFDTSKTRVVYLLGAGATHACVDFANASQGLLMSHLGEPLAKAIGDLSRTKLEYVELEDLVNQIIDDSTDYEHIITFLDESPSAVHRRFAGELRAVFHQTLSSRLHQLAQELEPDHFRLYSVFLDMYRLPTFDERLQGILSLNYDDYLEEAIHDVFGTSADYGIRVRGVGNPAQDAPRLLKLHGSFSWRDTWPVVWGADDTEPLWIPPGIHKTKTRYPFNQLWALARELLECDVLRVIGCRLSSRDWDLISLLFTTVHSHANDHTYTIEVIDHPRHTENLKVEYRYLPIKSIFEIEEMGIGRTLLSERAEMPGHLVDDEQMSFSRLSRELRDAIIEGCGDRENWFALWLQQIATAVWLTLPEDDKQGDRPLARFLEDVR